jgi:hypothetical protein
MTPVCRIVYVAASLVCTRQAWSAEPKRRPVADGVRGMSCKPVRDNRERRDLRERVD